MITFATKEQTDSVMAGWGYEFEFTCKKLLNYFKSDHYYTQTREGIPIRHMIRTTRAPMPDDIYWSNLAVPYFDGYARRFLTFLCTAVILAVSFGAQVALKVLQSDISKKQAPTESSLQTRAISLLITVVIMVVNQALSIAIKQLTFFEKHQTRTFFYQSLTIKIVAVGLP